MASVVAHVWGSWMTVDTLYDYRFRGILSIGYSRDLDGCTVCVVVQLVGSSRFGNPLPTFLD